MFHYPKPSFVRLALSVAFPAADSLMMRRQLANLRRLAERDASTRIS